MATPYQAFHKRMVTSGCVAVATHYDSRPVGANCTKWVERDWVTVWHPDGRRLLETGDRFHEASEELRALGYPIEHAELRGMPKHLDKGPRLYVLRAKDGTVLARGTEKRCRREDIEVPSIFRPTRVEADPALMAEFDARMARARALHKLRRDAHHADNLRVIRGVSPAVEQNLNENGGIWTFRQLADVEPGSDRARELGEVTGLSHRVDSWIAQARQLITA